MPNTDQNAFKNAQNQIKKAYDLYDSGKKNFEVISQPKRIIEVNVPVKMDNGETKIFTAFRSQHNNSRGPFK